MDNSTSRRLPSYGRESWKWKNLLYGLFVYQVWFGKSLIFHKIKKHKNSSHNGLTNLLSSRAPTMDSSYISIKYHDDMVKDFVEDALKTEKWAQLK